MLYTYNGIWFSLKKEGYPVTCYNMGEPWGHHAKGNMSVTKDKHYIIPLIRNMKNKQIHRIRKQNSGYQGLGVGKKSGLLLMSIEFQICKMKRVLKMDGGNNCSTMWIYLMSLNWILKNG